MKNIDWKRKLTSRKFWVAIVGFVTAILIAFGFGDMEIEQVVTVVMAFATLIAYIIGEGLVDASNVEKGNESSDEKEVKPE